MGTKALIIEKSTKLFQQKGYKGVGLNEILKECNVTKGGLYHHFPSGKEELLIACLTSLNDAITRDVEAIFKQYATTADAVDAMICKLIVTFEIEGTITGYTFSSIVSEMSSLNDSIRNACAELYNHLQMIYVEKLVADGFSNEKAHSIAVMITASIDGGIMLCLTKQSIKPLQEIAQLLTIMVKKK